MHIWGYAKSQKIVLSCPGYWHIIVLNVVGALSSWPQHSLQTVSFPDDIRPQSPSYHRAVWSIIPESRQRLASRPPRASFSPPPPSDDSADSFSCSFCSKVFKARPLLKQHLSVHMENSLSCPHCGAKFRWRSTRRNHIRKFHEPEPFSSSWEPVPECKSFLFIFKSVQLFLCCYGDVVSFPVLVTLECFVVLTAVLLWLRWSMQGQPQKFCLLFSALKCSLSKACPNLALLSCMRNSEWCVKLRYDKLKALHY